MGLHTQHGRARPNWALGPRSVEAPQIGGGLIGGGLSVVGGGLSVEAHRWWIGGIAPFWGIDPLANDKTSAIFITGQMRPVGVKPMQITIHKPLFELGQVLATTGATEAMQGDMLVAAILLDRHAAGDWGDLDQEDRETNDEAVKVGNRILSAYKLSDDGAKLWIITEWDRSATTILLPEEY